MPVDKRGTQGEDKPGGGQQLVIDFEGERKRRLRYGAFPKPPEVVDVPYAKRHDKADSDEGEVVAWLMRRREWLETIGAECDAVEAERPTSGPPASYTTHELEGALFFQFMSGIRTYVAARDRLAGDRGGRARAALGFDQPREKRCPQELKLMAGVPSESSLTRHRKRFPVERRLVVYRLYFDRLRKLNALDPVLRAGLRFLNIDGSAQLTSLTCPVKDQDGTVLNAKRVTCPEGGYIGRDAPPEKQGHGFGIVPLTCIHALPWAYDHGTINIAEGSAAVNALTDFGENVLPLTGERQLSVLSGDSGLNHRELRAAVRELGIIENISECSHTIGRASTDRDVSAANRRELDIKDYPNWYANGHRELRCRCGNGHIFHRSGLKRGKTFARVEGDCAKCGSITITSGLWKTVVDTRRAGGDPRGTRKLVRVQNGDPASVIDWAFGNPLTFHDPLSDQYGSMRFGHGEGFNGHCVTRFKLLKTKAYYRKKAQAELHALMVFCSMHGITAYRRDAAQDSGAPDLPVAKPLLALAA